MASRILVVFRFVKSHWSYSNCTSFSMGKGLEKCRFLGPCLLFHEEHLQYGSVSFKSPSVLYQVGFFHFHPLLPLLSRNFVWTSDSCLNMSSFPLSLLFLLFTYLPANVSYSVSPLILRNLSFKQFPFSSGSDGNSLATQHYRFVFYPSLTLLQMALPQTSMANIMIPLYFLCSEYLLEILS